MDKNNCSAPQDEQTSEEIRGDWKSQLQPDSRERIVVKITDTLKRHLPFSGPEGITELEKIAVRFEEKIYDASTSQSDYLHKISLKMLTMGSSLNSNDSGTSNSLTNPGPNGVQPQVANQVKSSLMPLPSNQSQIFPGLSSVVPSSQALNMPMSSSALPLPQDLIMASSSTPASGLNELQSSLHQQPNAMDQQKQFCQAQTHLPEFSSTSLDSTAQTGRTNGADWQEEVYQKIQEMKESYLPELSEMSQKIAAKLQQHDSLPQQPKSEQLEKLKMFKTMLERLITVLQVSKSNISPGLKEKLGLYEKQIINFINTNRPRKPASSLQLGQLPPPHIHSMQQPQSQITQVQSLENQMNPHLIQQNMNHPLQRNSHMESGQGSVLNSLQLIPVGSIQQIGVSATPQASVNAMSSQSGINILQATILQPNRDVLHNERLKQQQERHIYQNQNPQQRLLQQQLQQQLMRQKVEQQAKQQLSGLRNMNSPQQVLVGSVQQTPISASLQEQQMQANLLRQQNVQLQEQQMHVNLELTQQLMQQKPVFQQQKKLPHGDLRTEQMPQPHHIVDVNHVDMNPFSSQTGMNMLQRNIYSGNQDAKQPQEQNTVQNQLAQLYQQLQMQQQCMQRQQILQEQQQQQLQQQMHHICLIYIIFFVILFGYAVTGAYY